jgi:hypothetical protein
VAAAPLLNQARSPAIRDRASGVPTPGTPPSPWTATSATRTVGASGAYASRNMPNPNAATRRQAALTTGTTRRRGVTPGADAAATAEAIPKTRKLTPNTPVREAIWMAGIRSAWALARLQLAPYGPSSAIKYSAETHAAGAATAARRIQPRMTKARKNTTTSAKTADNPVSTPMTIGTGISRLASMYWP